MSRDWVRPFCLVLALTILAAAVVEHVFIWVVFGPPDWGQTIGHDLRLYTGQVQTVLGGGPWYHDRQLHGPYLIEWGDILYPPVTILFFAPWIVLPFVLWLAIPTVVVGYVVREWRPKPWAWVVIALCILWPFTLLKILSGNPSLWVVMLVALGIRFRWPAAFILLKPSFLPFALIGIRSRWWWVVAIALVVLSVPFAALTLQYPQVILDSRSSDGILYSIADLPMVMIPVIAWFARTRQLPED